MDILEGYANKLMLGMYEIVNPEEPFGENYKYKLPLWCAENGYSCLYQASTMSYVIFTNADNSWEIV